MSYRLLFLLVNFFLIVNISKASEFLVSNASEVAKIYAKLSPGDVLKWKNGDYFNQKIIFASKVNGTKENPITLKAETPGMVNFFGDSQIILNGSYLQVEGFSFHGECDLADKESVIAFGSSNPKFEKIALHCRVTNCAIIDYTLTEESGKNNNYVEINGQYNELDHCSFSGKTNKGPTVVVNYLQGSDYIKGSDVAQSTYHYIHHNYFGYRTYSDNGGEQLRVGVSATSGTRGYNLIEYNYFENTKIEAEVISNKSCNNIYRFNSLHANDGALVLRHGTNCIVYGNYINGLSDTKISGGIRIVNPNQTVFNNYIEKIEGGDKSPMKAPIVIMSGIDGADINEYYPADNAICAFNIINNSIGDYIKIGIGNNNKGRSFVAPQHVAIDDNILINSTQNEGQSILIADHNSTFTANDNVYLNFNKSDSNVIGIVENNFTQLENSLNSIYGRRKINDQLIKQINDRLTINNITLSEKEITASLILLLLPKSQMLA
jgi:poly(beta-D-mannuronate) lyase